MVDAATAPETKNTDKPDDTQAAKKTADPAAPAGTAAPPVARKPLGAKEVIPFAWKVIGVSGEMVLTLFKSIEKEDSEAHFARLTRDGAYKNLRLVEADFKIVQPKSVKAVFAANEKKTKTVVLAKKKKARTTAATIRLAPKKTTTSSAKKTKTSAAEKTKKAVRASTTKKKKVKKAVKKSTAKTVKAKKSAKPAGKKKTTTKSAKKKAKKKKKKK